MKYTHYTRKGISCNYLAFIHKGKTFHLPMVKIQIYSETEEVKTTALVDSGATMSFLPYTFAEEILGLPHVKEDVDVMGAGSEFKCFIAEASKITVIKGVNPIVDFEKVLVHVPYPESDLPYAVLGRDTIFQVYQILFREYEEKFILRRRRK